jgi:hypothetical protein
MRLRGKAYSYIISRISVGRDKKVSFSVPRSIMGWRFFVFLLDGVDACVDKFVGRV